MKSSFFYLIISLILISLGQFVQAQDLQPLQPEKTIENEIVGGQELNYQIVLSAKQFVRFRVEQNSIDLILILTPPEKNKPIEIDLTRAGDEESLSFEAETAGNYKLTIRAKGKQTLKGSFKLKTNLKNAAVEADKKRVTAESLMVEIESLAPQAGKASPQILEKSNQAVSIWQELKEPSWEAWSYSKAGIAYINLSQNDKAIEPIEKSLVLYQAAKNRSGEAESVTRLGVARMRMTEYAKADEYYQKAFEINREIKNITGEGQALVYLGQVQVYKGQFEKGIEYFESAMKPVDESNDKRLQAQLLFSLGNAYLGTSQFEKAIVIFEQTLALSLETKNRLYEGSAYANLAAAYGNTSRTEKAIEYTEKALTIYREFKDRVSEASMLINLGNNYLILNNYEKALSYQTEGLKLAREIKNRMMEARALQQIGTIKINQRKFDEAVSFNEEAIKIFQEIKAQSWESFSARGLGAALFELKQYEKAAFYHNRSLILSREMNDQAGAVVALYQLARDETGLGNLEKAQTYVEEAIKTAELLRASLGSAEFRSSYVASDNVQGAYRLYVDLLMQRHKLNPTKGYDSLAVEISERQRGRSLLDLLAESKTDLRQGVDPILLENEQKIATKLSDKAKNLTQTDKPEQVAALKLEISQLENDLERVQTAIRKSSPHYATITKPEPLKLKEIQAQLDADTVLLEYSLGVERSYLWVISKDSLKSYELPKEEEITRNVIEVYNLLTANNTKIKNETLLQRRERLINSELKLPNASQNLSNILLKSASSELGNKRLLVIADGSLQYIPFAMLADPSNKEFQPLVVNHEIVSLPSISALAVQRNELSNREPAPKTLAVVADPVFDKTDSRFKFTTKVLEDKEQPKLISDERGLEYIADNTTGKLIIRRLPFTQQEATSLVALAPKNSSIKLTGFQANRETVMSGELAKYRYVHFATHGLLDTERPGLSSLLLSMVDEKGKAENGFLRANDIYNLKLLAELVVLSACQTGLGKEIKGEGLIGLTRGFMYAGAKRVAVSLWSVNDKATAELMEKFYRGMLKEKKSPSAALRAAQIEMWKEKAWKSPYYWSSFIIQGDWR